MSSLIHIVGSAKYSESLSNLGGSFIQLTLKETDKCGAVWANIAKEERLSCITVKFSFKILEAGADGLALVLQSHSPSAIGTAGSGLGYDGIPNSIAIEFDNFHSKTDKNDPNGCHISIQTRGKLSNSSHHSFSKGCSTNVPDFSDGSEVYVAAEFNVTEKLVQVYLGHESDYYCILAAPVSFDGVIDQDKDLYVGFTAATGGLCQEHQICSFEVFESHS
jgi:peptide-N4-(N-acetyl-beta-glucosaminyl)asparagine amidase